MTKKEKMFAIHDGNGIWPWTIRLRRKDAITTFLSDADGGSWKEWRSKGYRCIPVTISYRKPR